jgi:uncharacterized membrane protein YdbT with pleckstrin-like domain
MAKKPTYHPATKKEKKTFKKYLAEDEELVVATGYGKNFMRHRFALFMLIPGGICWILAVVGMYYYLKNAGIDESDLWRLAVGYGLMIGLVLSMLVAYIKAIWLYHSHRYLLTTRRIIIKRGYFAVHVTSALFDKITHLEVDQSIIDRAIMGHGTIIINTAGVHKDVLSIDCVDDPLVFKNIIEKLINKEREHMGKPHHEGLPVEGEFVNTKKR